MKRRLPGFISRLVVLAIASLLLTAPNGVFAGGDDLFGDGAGHPPQFVGIARDIKTMKPVSGVFVVATLKDSNFRASTFADDEGRFRIEGFPDGFNPEAVEFTCSKTGYKMLKTIRRKISPDPKAPLEIECLTERS